ncbi:hypothetical protein QJQ45_021139, partial [Haematococcus lacustris]
MPRPFLLGENPTGNAPRAQHHPSELSMVELSDVSQPKKTPKVPTGQARVQVLYEEYVHLRWLKQVWDSPTTSKPDLEPCFAAAFHGIELAFLLMAQFVSDSRRYVAKRPRIEAMAMDIRAQCQLLGALVDGELEEEVLPHEAPRAPRTSLTQDFPFEGCPPTTPTQGFSPGLEALGLAVQGALPVMSVAEKNSLIKVVLLLSSAFSSAFQRWTVGVGIEQQVNTRCWRCWDCRPPT